MAIKKNPFNVGYSGEASWSEQEVRCECCRIPFRTRVNASDPGGPPEWCDICCSHAPQIDEPIERALARAKAHEKRYWAIAKTMSETAALRRREVAELKEAISHALESRGESRALLEAIAREHMNAPDGCSCGTKRCVTASIIDGSGHIGRRLRAVAEVAEANEQSMRLWRDDGPRTAT